MTKTINGIQVPQRADLVGSFLRPADLSDANRDEYVARLVQKQKELGYTLLTDGEFNRTFWHLDFFWGFGGVTHETGGDVAFNGETARLDRVYLKGKLTAQPHPFIEAYKRLKQLEDASHIAKLTVPSPAQFFQQLTIPQNFLGTKAIYPSTDDLIRDIAALYQDFIRQFYAAGGRYLQFDDCTWGAVVGDAAAQRYQNLNCNLDFVKDQLLRVARENVDVLYLEYDDERSGGFEPLVKVSPDKHVVLGLITTKRPELEDEDTVIARIHEAAKYIPLERLSLSPQCGFASCAIGNKLTEEQQWAKLQLVKRIAEKVWG